MVFPGKVIERLSIFAGVFLVSAAALSLEISLTRIFSFSLWYHFAFLIVSVALLGFGISGIFMSISQKMEQTSVQKIGAMASFLFAVTSILSLTIVSKLPLDFSHPGRKGMSLVFLAIDFLVLVVPFFFAGLAIVAVVSKLAIHVNQVYFSDLLGGGVGCLMAIGLISLLGGQGMVFFASLLGLTAALCFGFKLGKPILLSLATLAVVSGVFTLQADKVFPLQPMKNKSISKWTDKKQYPASQHTYTGWNAYSRIDVVENCGAVSWLFNPFFPMAQPPRTQIVIDGDAATSIVHYNGNPSQLSFLRVIPSALPYQLLKPSKALIIGAGGGVDVWTAFVHGSLKIDAVEINPLITDLMLNRYADYSGNVFQAKGVSLITGEGRHFVRRSRQKYDLIQLSLIDTWAALSSGAYSLSENYLYTVEAFQDYYHHLTEEGAIAITRWLWEPPRETLRLCSLGMESLRREGISAPQRHFAVYTMGGVATMIMKRDPFTQPEVIKLSELAQGRGFEVLYDPFYPRNNIFQSFFSASNPGSFMNSYRFDISPTTDDSPFFFLHHRWKDLNLLKMYRETKSILFVPGKLLLLLVFLISSVVSFVLLLLPLIAKKRGGINWQESYPYLIYFFGIGIGFMFIEILLMQKFSLFLGHPVYALSLVLFSLLVFSGFGSLSSLRLVGESKIRLIIAIGLLVFTLLSSFISFPFIFSTFMGHPLGIRVFIALGAIVPLSFLMGLPLPTGIRFANRTNPAIVPWGWGVNCFASVISSSLSVILAFELGFMNVSVVAGGFYLMAGLGLFFAGAKNNR